MEVVIGGILVNEVGKKLIINFKKIFSTQFNRLFNIRTIYFFILKRSATQFGKTEDRNTSYNY